MTKSYHYLLFAFELNTKSEWCVLLVFFLNLKDHPLDSKKHNLDFMYHIRTLMGSDACFSHNYSARLQRMLLTLNGSKNMSWVTSWLFIAISLISCLCWDMICAGEKPIACICLIYSYILLDKLEPSAWRKPATMLPWQGSPNLLAYSICSYMS